MMGRHAEMTLGLRFRASVGPPSKKAVSPMLMELMDGGTKRMVKIDMRLVKLIGRLNLIK